MDIILKKLPVSLPLGDSGDDRSSVNDKSNVPVIAGAVSGGCVVLILVILALVMLRR